MVVLTLVQHRNRETVQLLRAMLEMAERGELHDINVTYRYHGTERNMRTGLYRRSPAHALRAAVRLTIDLAQDNSLA